MRKRITAILLVLCMCMNLLPDVFEPQEVYAEEDTVVETGSCGENATYTVYSSGYAVVEGTGEAELCTSSNFDILIIESGITKISSIYTFYGSTLMLNEGLEVIGSGVIGPYIEELTVPSTVTEFEVNSLIQHQIKEITFLGKKPKMLIECFGLEGPQHQITAYYPEGEWAQADFQYLNAVTTWIPCTWADGKRIPDESQKYTVSKWVPQVRETGSCGANAYYTMYDEGTLIIEGTGYIEERTWNTAKWVEVKEGITGLADPEYHIYDNGIFNEGHYPGYKETVLLPSTLEYIGNGAFYCCEALKNIGITKNPRADLIGRISCKINNAFSKT